MKLKMNILVIAIILAIVVFGISTYMQKKLIHYEATVSVLVLTQDIHEKELAEKDKFKVVNVPISLVMTQRIVSSFEEIQGLYARDNILSGQFVMKNQFDTKENLSIYEAEEGKEKIAIKIKSPENGVSFQVNENAMVNVYATLRNEYANHFLEDKERMSVGEEYDGYTVIKVLEHVRVLGVFTIEGMEYEKTNNENIDTILISVLPEEAKSINLIREIATFNITGE